MDRGQLDRLRTLTALVHSSPGATLHLECTNGAVVVAGTHDAADLSPCQLRRVVSAAAHPSGCEIIDRIAAISVGGTLEPAGPGIYDDRSRVLPTKRVVSLLRADLVEEVLSSVNLEGLDISGLEAHITADEVLGVSCVELSRSVADPPELLATIAAAAAGAIMVRECEISPPLTQPGSPTGTRRPQW